MKSLAQVRNSSPVVFLLGVAFVLFAFGCWYGLPRVYHADEEHEVVRALQLGQGHIIYDRIAKGGLYFLLFVEYGAYFAIGRVTGLFHSRDDFALQYVRDPTVFYLLGRLTVAALGVLGLLAVYRLAKRVDGKSAALLSVAAVMFSYRFAYEAHFTTVDVPMMSAVLWSFELAFRAAETGRRRFAGFAGVTIAVAALCKVVALLAVPGLLVAFFFRRREARDRTPLFPLLLVAGAAFAIVYLIGAPGILIHGKEMLLGLWLKFTGRELEVAQSASKEIETVRLAVATQSAWLVYGRRLWLDEGPAIVMFGAGLLVAFKTRKSLDWALLSFLAIYGLVFGTAVSTAPNYLVPFTCTLAILGGRAVGRWTSSRKPLFFLVALAWIYPLGHVVQKDYQFTQPDTRTVAKQWFEAHVRSDTKVLVDGTRFRIVLGPPLTESPESIQRRLQYLDENPRDVPPSRAGGLKSYYRYKLRVSRPPWYDVLTTGWGVGVTSLDEYIRDGVRYLAISEAVRGPFVTERARKRYPRIYSFYAGLDTDPRLKLVTEFRHHLLKHPGPDIRVYEVRE